METIKINGLDEIIYKTISKDGLPIYIWKNEYAKSFYLSLNVKYGSLDTEFEINNKKIKVPNGIAHFMEHIKFNVKKDVTANDLFDPLGSDINAFTTFKYTSYLVMGTSKIGENLNNLLDYVFNPYFTKEMIQKEKGIIASEINMGHDMPYNELYFKFNECMYHKEKYRNLITGEVDDIKKITLKDVELIYNAFYHPKNMFLVVTGNVNPYEIEKIANENLGEKEICESLNPTKLELKEPKSVCKKELEIFANVEVEKAKIGVKIPKSKFKDINDSKLNILMNIILNCNFGDTSDFKEELLQQELVTYLSASRFILKEYVVIDITIESKYLDEAIKRITKKLKELSVDEEDLKRKVNSLIATLILNYEDVESVNNMIQNYIINYGEIIENIKDIYESITLDDVKNIIKSINTKEISIVKMKKK